MARGSGSDGLGPGLLPATARRRLLGLVAMGVAQAAATGGIVIMVDRLVAGLVEARGVPTAGLAVMAALVGAIAALRYGERVEGERLGQAVAHHVRQLLGEHLFRLPATTGRHAPGGVLLRFVGDLAALRNWYARGLVSLCVTAPMLVAGLAAIAWLEWRIALALALALCGAAAAQAALAPGLRRTARAARRCRARLAAHLVERVDALATVQAFGRTGAEARRISRRSADLAEAMVARARWSGLLRGAAESLAAGLPLVVLLGWSAAGSISIGAAASSLGVGALLAGRARELGRVLEYLTLARISEERIAAFLRRPALDPRAGARPTRRRAGRLALRGLVIDEGFPTLDLAAAPGARVALTGPNGAGKSRLLGVLAGLEEPRSGRIVLDGQDVTRRRLASLRRLVALASADTPVMRGTVDRNIHYGARGDAADSRAILEAAGYDTLVAELPQGGGTRVGPGGRGLSLGQKRRVILMRALLRRPLVLLLDEIEAGLDAAGREMLAGVFAGFDGSIIMATHSADWIGRCDTLWSLPPAQPAAAPIERREVLDG